MKEKFLLATLLIILVFNQSKAQFNSVTDCAANGTGHSIFFINADTGFVAGEDTGKGVIQRTMDGGNTWARVYTSVASLKWVEDILFTDSANGVAVGVGGIILTTTDGGSSWNRQTIPNVTMFASVCFPSSLVGYAAGNGNPQGPIYKTIDGGANWTAQTSNADSALRSIFFVNIDTGYAVGEYDIVKTTDGGTTWTRSINNNSFPSSDPEHIEMYCTDANTCYIPYGSIRKTTDGGNTWNPLTLPSLSPPYYYYISAIYFTDSLTGFAVGANVDTSTFNLVGVILMTTDAGQTWTNINTVANNDSLDQMPLSSVRFVNSQTGYTTGMRGKVLKTTDGGGFTTTIAPVNEKANEMNIYPNPTTGIFTIAFPKTSGQIQIINSIGQVLDTKIIDGQTSSGFQINDDGIYFVQLISANQTVTKRVVVCK